MAKHTKLGLDKKDKHKPGCVTRHVGTYVEDNPCSHRWNAAKRARAEKRINYTDANTVSDNRWIATEKATKKAKRYLGLGKIKSLGPAQDGRLTINIEPFATFWWPWLNNAHHIIPRSTLAKVLDVAAKQAAPNEAEMMDLAVEGLLDEKYNLNAEVNMIALPIREKQAAAMNLPRHLQGWGAGARDHPVYSQEVHDFLEPTVTSKYKALAAQMKDEKHDDGGSSAAVAEFLNDVSDFTYTEIITNAAAQRAQGLADVTLDSITPLLYG